MARFIVTKKLTIKEALDSIVGIEKWFADNPTRKICQTDVFKVRRGFSATDILKHAVDY